MGKVKGRDFFSSMHEVLVCKARQRGGPQGIFWQEKKSHVLILEAEASQLYKSKQIPYHLPHEFFY
jgi:hypothetical protein